MMNETMTRREFAGAAGAAVGAAAVLGAPAIGTAAQPSEKVRLVLIGAGSRGNQLLDSFLPLANVDIVGIADVDDQHAGKTADRIKKAKGNTPDAARDYRGMLDHKDVDAVIIATPDHWHALPAIQAVLAGKDVYVEKPVGAQRRRGPGDDPRGPEDQQDHGRRHPAAVLDPLPEGRRDRPLGQARQGLLGPDLELREHQPGRHGQLPRHRGALVRRLRPLARPAPRRGRSTRTGSTCCSAGSSTTPAA